jgi:poly-gamma-glutamate system protein
MIIKILKALRDRSSLPRLVLLTLVLAGFSLADSPLSPEETRLYRRIRDAQRTLWAEMEARGEADPVNDPGRTGFIGLEWSETTTTLGSLDSKQNSCDPLWGVKCLRWFDTLGLKAGDRIVVSSSASFPGMLYSVLCAAEFRNLAIDLTVSLGASAWGANRPGASWPVLSRILRARGFLAAVSLFYTLGGEGENGGGMFPPGIEALERAATEDGVELFRSNDLSGIISRKMALIAPEDGLPARLVVSIGGNESSLGLNDQVLGLPNGLLLGDEAGAAGDGIIALSLRRGIPVLHLLNLRSLAGSAGIDFNVRRPYFTNRPLALSLLGLLAFVLTLASHRRWTWEA